MLSFKKIITLLVLGCLLFMTGACKKSLSDADYFERAKQYQDKGELQAAVVELKNALQQNPKNADARLLLGKLYIRLGDGVSARKELELAKQSGIHDDIMAVPLGQAYLLAQDPLPLLAGIWPKNEMWPEIKAEIWTLRGQAYQLQGNLKEADKAFQAALAEQPTQVDALLGMGHNALQRGWMEVTKQWLDKAQAAAPDNPAVWQLQGEYEQRQSHWPAAEAAFNKALALNAKSFPARIGLVEVLLQQGKVNEASQALAVFQGKGRQPPQVLYYLALIDFINKNYSKTEERLQELFKTNPDYPLALQLMALTQYNLGNMQQAEDFSQRRLQQFLDSSEARKLKALVELRKGSLEPDKLQAKINDLTAQFPQDIQVLNAIADALQAQGKPAEATEYLKKVAQLEPDSAAARVRLSQLLMAQDKPEQAILELEKAKELGTQSTDTDLMLTVGYLKSKEFDRALTALQPLLEKQPGASGLWNLAGVAYLGKGQFDKAQTALQKALELSSGNPGVIINLVQLALAQGDTDKARRYYRQGLEQRPDDVQLLLGLAALEQGQGNKEAYIKQLDEAIRRQPQALQPRLLRARAYLEQNDPSQARSLLLEVQEKHGMDPGFLLVLGNTDLMAGDTDAAIRDFKQVLKVQPDSVAAYYSLAGVYGQKGNFKQMQKPLFKALTLQSDNPLVWPLLEQLVVQAPKNKEVSNLLQTLQARFPNNREAMAVTGELALQSQDYQRATQVYQQALTVFPNDAEFTRKLAETYLRQGNQTAFLSTVQNGLKNYPQDLQMQRLLADYYSNYGRDSDARTAFTKLLEQDPNNYEVLNNLAWVLRKQRNLQQARQYAEKALTLAPDNTAVLDTLAMILLDQGEKQRALELLRKAARQQPEDRNVLYHLTKALTANEQKDEARRILRTTLNDKTAFDSRQDAEALLKNLGE